MRGVSLIGYGVMIVIAIIGLIAGGYALKAGLISIGVPQTMSQIDSAGHIIGKTYDADNAIYNYEWFKNQFEKIKATELQINNTKKELDNYKELYGNATLWDWQTRQDYNQLRTTYLGQKNYYETLVATYNARSKMANRNIFINNLPFHLDKKLW